jgi:hypothetical protein
MNDQPIIHESGAARFNVVIVSPAGYQFSETFREIAETVCHGLQRLGQSVSITHHFEDAATNIILGGHLLHEEGASEVPEGSIIYNFEQIHGGSKWIKPVYVDLVRSFRCWDYSPRNITMWNRYCPEATPVHVPLGYTPELSRIEPTADEDIDVLFYGIINERRAEILNKLHQAGLNVRVLVGKFGAERDALIARAKVVLNVHFFDTKIFELPRVSYLLANRKAVVSEVGQDTEMERDLAEAVAGVRYEALVQKCVELVFDDAARRRVADAGFRIFAQRDEAAILATALADRSMKARPLGADLPHRINVGSGKGWNLEALNVDIDPRWRPDFVADLNRPIPLDEPVDLGRFGMRKLPAGYFQEINASHILEHLVNLVTAMESFLHLLTEGGILVVEVPYDLSYGAWQDPTHVRAFNERSWLYYTEWFWYLGWSDYRFQTEEVQFIMSEHGQAITTSGANPEDAVRIPRAVDAMRVRLRKVALTPAERYRTMQRWQE